MTNVNNMHGGQKGAGDHAGTVECSDESQIQSQPEQPSVNVEALDRVDVDRNDITNSGGVDSITVENTARVRNKTLVSLYISHFLSTWNSRVFEFGAVLFLATIFPQTLRPLSIYALTSSASAILFSQVVGNWIDRGNRIVVVRVSIIGQRIAVIASCGAFWVLDRLKLSLNHDSLTRGLFALLVLLACAEKVCSVMNLVAIERDWVVVITENDEQVRRTVNARMRRIDLFCKLVGPLVISLVATPSIRIAIWTTLAMGSISVVVEYVCISWVYRRFPSLCRIKIATNAEDPQDSITQSRLHRVTGTLKSAALRIVPIQSLPFYFRHRVCLPSLALSLLYLTVLSFSGQMINYLVAVGYKSGYVGAARAGSTVIELSATWVAPRLMRRIGVVRTGLWSICWQMFWLTAAVSWFLAHDFEHGTSMIDAASGLAVGVALSRLGLWGYDLSEQNLVQDAVDGDNRGRFSTVEAALQNLFQLLSYVTTLVFSRPSEFRWPIIISAAATYTAGGIYTYFVRKTQGHLLHRPKFLDIKRATEQT